jgi:hypothetical protein
MEMFQLESRPQEKSLQTMQMKNLTQQLLNLITPTHGQNNTSHMTEMNHQHNMEDCEYLIVNVIHNVNNTMDVELIGCTAKVKTHSYDDTPQWLI